MKLVWYRRIFDSAWSKTWSDSSFHVTSNYVCQDWRPSSNYLSPYQLTGSSSTLQYEFFYRIMITIIYPLASLRFLSHLLYCLLQKLQINSPALSNLLKYDPVLFTPKSCPRALRHISLRTSSTKFLLWCVCRFLRTMYFQWLFQDLSWRFFRSCTLQKRDDDVIRNPDSWWLHSCPLWFPSLHRIYHPFSYQLIR